MGRDAPTMADLGTQVSRANYHLHVKKLPPIDLEELLNVASGDGVENQQLARAVEYVTDPGKFSGVRCREGVYTTAMGGQDMGRMRECDKIETVSPEQEEKEPTMGSCRVFKTAEDDKERYRPIMHTVDVNEGVTREISNVFPDKLELHRHLVVKGMYAIHLDMSAWFDQIPLGQGIRRYLRFRDRKGRLYQCTRLPMGATFSVDVAHTIMTALVGPAIEGVITHIYVDNVRFMGIDKSKVIRAAQQFANRCKRVGATVNELQDDKPVAELVTQGQPGEPEAKFLGEEYDLVTGAVRATEKTLKKLALSWSRRSEWTRKGLAAHFALLFYTSSSLNICPSAYFNAMRLLRAFSARMQQEPDTWNERLGFQIAAGVIDELQQWTSKALANKWNVISEATPPSKRIVVDASEWGYGVACWNGMTLKLLQVQWEPEFATKNFSAHAEPEALWRTLLRFVTRGEAAVVQTDHQAFEFATRSGYSKSYYVNQVLGKIDSIFGRKNVQIEYIKGSINPVDYLSRNRVPSQADIALMSRWGHECRVRDQRFAEGYGFAFGSGGIHPANA
jgi:hypothetical protein